VTDRKVEKELDMMVSITLSRIKGICQENGMNDKGCTMVTIYFINRLVKHAWKGVRPSVSLTEAIRVIEDIDDSAINP
jgi:hypothetical protein